MKFELINPKADQGFIQKIEFNFDELKSEITKSLEKYQNLVYDEEQIKEAKTDRASLNKFKEALETERKRVKKLCLKPYEEFEAKVKELVKLVDEPILAIDTQIKAQEDKRAEEKKEELENHFNEVASELFKNTISFEKIFNQKWLNTTYNIKKAKEDILNIIQEVETNIDTINDLKLPNELRLAVANKFLENLSLTEALQEKTRLEELQKKLESKQAEKEHIVDVNKKVENLITLKFWAKGTKEQLLNLKAFMKAQGIEFGSIVESEK